MKTPVGGIDENSDVFIDLFFDTDSVKIMLEDKIVGVYNVDFNNYSDKGCCDGYENYNIYYDNEFCGDCLGKTIIITL